MTAASDAVTVEVAAGLVRGGARFGDVFPRLAGEAARAEFREWFTRAAGVPVNPSPARARAAATGPAPLPVPSGDLCPKCGGLMVRTGTCSTCSSCGESSGGCG
jgi:hypothetical protein